MSEGPILQKLVQIKRINLRKILIDLSSKRDNFLASDGPNSAYTLYSFQMYLKSFPLLVGPSVHARISIFLNKSICHINKEREREKS